MFDMEEMVNKNLPKTERKESSSFLMSTIILFMLILLAVFVAVFYSPLALIKRLKPLYLTDDKGIIMAFVPEGSFIMGSNNGDEDEKPVHTVYLKSFYVDKFEVTNASYQICVDAGVCTGLNEFIYSFLYNAEDNSKYDNFPVVNVDWYMAKTYCEWRGARLPTEAEWEKAARGPFARIYPWGDGFGSNYVKHSGDWRPEAVGSYEDGKSVYGVYDMAGNVQEWVNSLYMPYPYDFSGGRENITSPDQRVQRGGGGAWAIYRTSDRTHYYPTDTKAYLGLRCARDTNP